MHFIFWSSPLEFISWDSYYCKTHLVQHVQCLQHVLDFKNFWRTTDKSCAKLKCTCRVDEGGNDGMVMQDISF